MPDLIMKPTVFQNEDAERNLLAYIATSKNNRPILEALTESDFSKQEYRRIYAAMNALMLEGKAIDLVTIANKLLSIAGNDKLDELLADCVAEKICNSEWNAKQYVAIVKAAAKRRRLFEIFESGKNALQDETADVDVVYESIRQEMQGMAANTGNKWLTIGEAIIDAHEYIEKIQKGEIKSMPTGIETLDAFTTGLHRGELTILGARPAVGKSALGMHIALAAAEAGYKISVCSREMTAIQYGMRVLARGIDFDSIKLRNGNLSDDEWAKVNRSYERYANLDVSFTFTTKSIEELRVEVQKKVDANEIDLLIVDYAQIMQTRRRFDADYQRIGYITKMLKDMTTDFNIAILALAQVGRASEGDMPTMAELRGSGDIEQDADNVIFLHRPKDASDEWVYPDHRSSYFNAVQERGLQYIVLNVAKQRQGETGHVYLLFSPNNVLYRAITKDDK